ELRRRHGMTVRAESAAGYGGLWTAGSRIVERGHHVGPCEGGADDENAGGGWDTAQGLRVERGGDDARVACDSRPLRRDFGFGVSGCEHHDGGGGATPRVGRYAPRLPISGDRSDALLDVADAPSRDERRDMPFDVPAEYGATRIEILRSDLRQGIVVYSI